MTTVTRTVPLRRAGVTGFVTGFGMAFVGTALALVSRVFEAVHTLLVPATALLGPAADRMADWNGLLNMVIAGTINGAAYALVFTAVVALLRSARAGTGQR